jgi:hypothetical protein
MRWAGPWMEADTGRTSGWRRLLLCFSPLTLFPSPHFSFPSQDAYLNTTLNTLEDLGLLDDTVVIKTADHGEMAMSHQGQVDFFFFLPFFPLFFLGDKRHLPLSRQQNKNAHTSPRRSKRCSTCMKNPCASRSSSPTRACTRARSNRPHWSRTSTWSPRSPRSWARRPPSRPPRAGRACRTRTRSSTRAGRRPHKTRSCSCLTTSSTASRPTLASRAPNPT